MRHSPTKVLHFLAHHYVAVGALFALGKKQNQLISDSQLHELQNRYGLKKQLIDYKLLTPMPAGGYSLAPHYLSFWDFLQGDFSLQLPEQLAKYDLAIKALTLRLRREEKDTEMIATIISQLIQEISNFLAHLSQSTTALEQEVDALRVHEKGSVDYGMRIRKASQLINLFLDPLNKILENHEDAISHTLYTLRTYTYTRTLALPDSYRAASYLDLHRHLTYAEDEIHRHLRTLLRTLLPLLEQIKMSNRLLMGFKLLREHHKKGEEGKYLPLLPGNIKRQLGYTYSRYCEGNAQALIADAGNRQPLIIHQQAEAPAMWRFYASPYRAHLMDRLPIPHFFLWCKDAMQEIEGDVPISKQKFLKVANLMFSQELQLTFSPQRSILALEDAILDVPQIHVDHDLSQAT